MRQNLPAGPASAVLSPMLLPGNRVRLVSPASFPSRTWLDKSIEILESWGLTVDVGEHALDQWGYMAGRDQDRLDDLNNAFRDPDIRAIITTRGGAGAYRDRWTTSTAALMEITHRHRSGSC